ncbi:MAG: hypothetical protein GC188_10615 [Alphaproteobacteria bacterium]|nr:hypothetical protein [Alphaproteobacteria bacterium]
MTLKQLILSPFAAVVFFGVAEAQSENGAIFTPEGTIIHHWHDGENGGIAEIDIDGQLIRILTESGAHMDRWPALGNNGQDVTFISTRDGRWSVFSVGRRGGEVSQITRNYVQNLGAAPTPDGVDIYFAQTADDDENRFDILRYRGPDATLERVIENGIWPKWSPAGGGFFFGRGNGPETGFDVMFYDIATGHVSQVTNLPGDEFSPTISPDGIDLYFVHVTESGAGLSRQLLESGEVTDLELEMRMDSSPAFSPDGRFMVYANLVDGQYDLFRQELASGETVNISQSGWNNRPAVSFD